MHPNAHSRLFTGFAEPLVWRPAGWMR